MRIEIGSKNNAKLFSPAKYQKKIFQRLHLIVIIVIIELPFNYCSLFVNVRLCIDAQIIRTVCILLRERNREVVKAVIGFCKVVCIRVEDDVLKEYLGDMVQVPSIPEIFPL